MSISKLNTFNSLIFAQVKKGCLEYKLLWVESMASSSSP